MEKVLDKLKEIGIKYSNSIDKISLFGSRARGDFSERSDFDVAVFFAGEVNYNALPKSGDKARISK